MKAPKSDSPTNNPNPLRLLPAVLSTIALVVCGVTTLTVLALAAVQLTTLPSPCRALEDPNQCAGRQVGEVIGTLICPCFCVGSTVVLLLMTLIILRRSAKA